MALFPKSGGRISGLVSSILGTSTGGSGKALRIGSTKSAAQIKAELEQRQADVREELESFRENAQVRGRLAWEQHRGKSYPNVKPMGRGDAPDEEAFMYGESYARFASSNVMELVYDITKDQLYVRFKNNRWYRYDGVTKTEAQRFYHAYSKGVEIWSVLRVRGKGNAKKTQKRFTRDAAPPSYLPLDRTVPLMSFGSRDILAEAARQRGGRL